MPRTPERKNSADRAEVVLGGPRMPLIERQLLDRREKPKSFGVHPMDERASLSADRAVARSDVIQFDIHFEPRPPTVARTAIRFHDLIRDPVGRPRPSRSRSAS